MDETNCGGVPSAGWPAFPPATCDELLRQVTDQMCAAIWLQECSTGKTLYVSPNFATIFGRAGHEHTTPPRDRWSMVHPDDRDSAREAYHRDATRGTHDEQYRVVCGDGRTVWIRERAVPIRDERGQVLCLTVIFEDVTSRYQAERQLRRHALELAGAGQLAAVASLVAGIAHQINQPLHAIANFAGACKNLAASGSDDALRRIVAWATEIDAQVRRASDIISQWNRAVYVGARGQAIVDVNQMVRETLELVTCEAGDRDVRLILEEHASRPATVRGDRLQLQHALVHLLDNAFDAVESLRPADRQVTVTTEADSVRVIVRVRDVGAGLGGADIQKLCEPFFTTKEGHAGLGLTISRRIITSHDGELSAATHESGGAIFQLEIPASC